MKYTADNMVNIIALFGVDNKNIRPNVLWGARCSSMVRAFIHGAMGWQIKSSWGGLIELFIIPSSAS